MKVKTTIIGTVAAVAVFFAAFHRPDGSEDHPDDREKRAVVYSANWSLNVRGGVQWGKAQSPKFRGGVKPPFQERGEANVGDTVTIAVSLEFATRNVEAFRCWITVNNEVHDAKPYRDGKHCVLTVVIK